VLVDTTRRTFDYPIPIYEESSHMLPKGTQSWIGWPFFTTKDILPSAMSNHSNFSLSDSDQVMQGLVSQVATSVPFLV
jgi:hypothetical protein